MRYFLLILLILPFDVHPQQAVTELQMGHQDEIIFLQKAKINKKEILVSGSISGMIKIWDAKSLIKITDFKIYTDNLKDAEYIEKENLLITLSDSVIKQNEFTSESISNLHLISLTDLEITGRITFSFNIRYIDYDYKNGTLILLDSENSEIKFLNLKSKTILKSFKVPSQEYQALIVAGTNAKSVLLVGADGTIYNIDLQNGNTISEIKFREEEPVYRKLAVDYFAPKELIVFGYHNEIIFYDLKRNSFLSNRLKESKYGFPFTSISAVKFSPDGKLIGIGGETGEVGILNSNTLQLHEIELKKNKQDYNPIIAQINAIEFTSDSKFMFTGLDKYNYSDYLTRVANEKNKIYLINCISNKFVSELPADTEFPINCFSTKTGFIYIGNRGTIKNFDLRNVSTWFYNCKFEIPEAELADFKEPRLIVGGSSHYPDYLSNYVYFPDYENPSVNTRNETFVLLHSMAIDKNDKIAYEAYSNDDDYNYIIYTGLPENSITRDWDNGSIVKLDDNGKLIIAASYPFGTARIFETDSGTMINSFGRFGAGTASLSIDKQNSYIGFGYRNGIIDIYDIDGGFVNSDSLHLGWVSANCFSSDSKKLISGGWDKKIVVRQNPTMKSIYQIVRAHDDRINSVSVTNDNKRFLTTSTDGSVRCRDLSDGKLIYTLYNFNPDNHLFITPDNFYYGQKNLSKLIGFRIGSSTYLFEQFDLKYNRPDIVLERIGYAPPGLIDAYRNAYYKRIKKMGFTEEMLKGDFHVPDIEILNKEDLTRQTTSRKLTFQVSANDSIEKLDRLNIWINNITIFGMPGIDLKVKNTHSIRQTIEVELSAGENKIEVSVLNQAGSESLKDLLNVTYNGNTELPDLYLVSIGVSEYTDTAMNLRYTVKDGRDMVNHFAGRTDLYGKIHTDTLFNQNVTRQNILKLKEKLRASRVDDKVIIFLSGHGLLSDSQDFYYATNDVDFNKPDKKGILYDDLEGILDGIPARSKLLLIDACHSGELDKEGDVEEPSVKSVSRDNMTGKLLTYTFRGNKNLDGIGLQNSFELMQELFTNLSRGSGAVVISAAAGNGYAFENHEWKNGAFTFTLLNGLKNDFQAVDTNSDQEISVNEIKNYVITGVENLTSGSQKPTCRRENLENDWRIW
jgi:WD40 repeat protein